MYFSDLLGALLRQWIVVGTGLVLTLGGAYFTVQNVPTQYQASGQLLFLLPSEATGASTPTNPYLNLQDGLTTAATLVAGDLMTLDEARSLTKAGHRSAYSASVAPGAGPLLVITAVDTDPEAALATRDAVMDRVDERLANMQREAAVPERQLIHTSPSAVGSRAEALRGSKIRALAVVLAVGLFATLLVALGFDRRRRRKKTPADPADDERRTGPGGPDGAEPLRRHSPSPLRKPTPGREEPAARSRSDQSAQKSRRTPPLRKVSGVRGT